MYKTAIGTFHGKPIAMSAWNTNAPYTEEGQRMAAAKIADTVYFVDIDRGIDGTIGEIGRPETYEIRALVDRRYILNEYSPGIRGTDEIPSRELTKVLLDFAKDNAPKLQRRQG